MYFENCFPETITADMHQGLGSQSMRRAAGWWEKVGRDMTHLEESFMQVFEGLQQQWSGPVATQVREAAQPFVEWLTDLCAQLSETAAQIYHVGWAWSCAYNGVVPMNEIGNNRRNAATAVINNALGQNSALIAKLDQEYEDFRERNIDVMKDYADTVFDALSSLPRWKPPPPIANKTGLVQPSSESCRSATMPCTTTSST
ncbi:PPE family protein [Mycobacterium haemophilum DSM 44634]|uniref:PPE family protein n=1 Tax=Mycobacterium haemophilum TaxID=29311 RepID=UPI0006555EA4|nr:PPE family protein [Mycobacterium haemophilum]AKN16091.1 hypothetical protein B586_05145 [Mycobacterium haemophilum DSM 44634]MCV7339972.1 PPE family protein [Mycobacterium haemophilum DSM 44634]